MNMSRSRRLIVLLSHAYLEQDWCSNNFRSDSYTFILSGDKHLSSSVQALLCKRNRRVKLLLHENVPPEVSVAAVQFAAVSLMCCGGLYGCRQGLLYWLELCQQPILIMLESQSKRMSPEIKQQLSENQHRLTILIWRHNSVVRCLIRFVKSTVSNSQSFSVFTHGSFHFLVNF